MTDSFGFSFRDIADLAEDILIVTRADPIDRPGPEIVYVNRAFTRLTGYTFDEAVGNTPRMLQGPETDPAALAEIRRYLEARTPCRIKVKNYAKDGQSYWLELIIYPLRDDTGKVTHFAAVQRDITEQELALQVLRRLADSDPLTGVLNRRSFRDSLDLEWARFRRAGHRYAVATVDLDTFKEVNDSRGHEFGDRVLKEVVGYLRRMVRTQDVIGRIGGDEFAVLMPDTVLAAALASVERLRAGIALLKVDDAGAGFRLTVSIGVSEVRPGDSAFTDVLERSDKALFAAKAAGRNCCRAYGHRDDQDG